MSTIDFLAETEYSLSAMWISDVINKQKKILALSPMADPAPDLPSVGQCGAGMTDYVD